MLAINFTAFTNYIASIDNEKKNIDLHDFDFGNLRT